MNLSNYRYNRVGGIDADRELDSGEIVPYTLSSDEVAKLPKNTAISPYIKPEPTENDRKLNAFEYNGIACSIHKKDRDGWTNITLMLNDHMADGGVFVPFTFYMENGNNIKFNELSEWDDFRKLGREVVFEFYSNKES